MTSVSLAAGQGAADVFELLANSIIRRAALNRCCHHTTGGGAPPSGGSQPIRLLENLARAIPQDSPGREASSFTVQAYLDQHFASVHSGKAQTATAVAEPETKVEEGWSYDGLDVEQKSAGRTLPGELVRIGPYGLRPVEGCEVPFGRDYQPIPYESISRLAGYLGADEYSMFIREVPDSPHHGLKPSANGIWVKQKEELYFRRLHPGQAERITPQTDIRIGGNGFDAETGFPIHVI